MLESKLAALPLAFRKRFMLMLTSAEFVALCRAQVILLTQALGASLSVVYLTQELVEGAETQLIPIVAYPETAVDWQAQGGVRSLPSTIDTAKPPLWLLAEPYSDLSQAAPLPATLDQASVQVAGTESFTKSDRAPRAGSDTEPQPKQPQPEHSQSDHAALVPERRIVMPLMHETAVLGLLVTERNDRLWTESEQAQIHQIAETLAIARVLDQRDQWLEHEQRQQLQAQQHDLLDNLLHQFRNSLTTLQTFGKLILKRLLPEDANRDVAASLVRETSRLRDLAQQLEWAVAETDALKPQPLTLPPAFGRRLQEQQQDVATDQHLTGSQQQESQTLPLLPAADFLSRTAFVLEPCPLAMALEPLLASASAIAQERSLTLLTDIPNDLPSVFASRQLLQEVLSNAIDNALKYTPAGGLVLVEAGVREGKKRAVEIAISDTGPGIPPKDLPHIFERRYRGVQAQTAIPGSGLGLAIARALVTQMQGEIYVFSPAQVNSVDQNVVAALTAHGQGTTVMVRLAIAEASKLTLSEQQAP
ncbi:MULTISPECIES: GAF domain-containing sensor histidine kinase [Cyanophyceae]|nr:sensor histidine kinase [Phormidium sp. FACHB-592]